LAGAQDKLQPLAEGRDLNGASIFNVEIPAFTGMT